MVDPKRPSSRKSAAKKTPVCEAENAVCETETTVCQPESNEKLNRHWRGEFLTALAATSNVAASAAAAGVPPSRAYHLKRTNPDFARAWYGALLEGYEHLEMEVLYRLRFGDPKDTSLKFDNATALRLLSHHREAVGRERAMREHEDVAAVRARIDARLDNLREEGLAWHAEQEAIAAGTLPAPETGHA
jgi:hypothetical protein